MQTLLTEAEAYTADGFDGIAWHYIEDETKPDADTEWTGIEVPTGNVVMVMVGDDTRFTFDPMDITPIGEDDYCPGCGQIPSCY